MRGSEETEGEGVSEVLSRKGRKGPDGQSRHYTDFFLSPFSGIIGGGFKIQVRGGGRKEGVGSSVTSESKERAWSKHFKLRSVFCKVHTSRVSSGRRGQKSRKK